MKIGLLMGSFNPVHLGHVSVARYAVEHSIVDFVWAVVSPKNPLKELAQVSFEQRIEMVKIAFDRDNGISVCEVEGELGSPSYTYNTILELKRRYPDYQFSILCGSDIVNQLDKWYRIDDLKKEVEFLVYPRCGFGGQVVSSKQFEGAELVGVSSSEARQLIEKRMLPNAVYDYIIENDLYVDSWGREAFYDKGCLCYAKGEFGATINALNKSLDIDPDFESAKEMLGMVREILAFRNTDLYNP